MQHTYLLFILLLLIEVAFSQKADTSIINTREVDRVERVLSSDEMEGRRIFKPGIDRAADFIASEFRKAGLQPVQGGSYFQLFDMLHTTPVAAAGSIGGKPVPEQDIAVITSQPDLSASSTGEYKKIRVSATDTLRPLITRLMKTGNSYFLLVDTVHRLQFNGLKRYMRDMFPSSANILMMLTSEDPASWTVHARQEVVRMPLKNVVGILPGHSRKEEQVIFSAHYDHLGIGRPNAEGDSIFNGANDDAAGTTAVILLARHFAKLKNNERTLVFAAFTGEEEGGYGSHYFSERFDPAKVVAMFNIEMIGTESKWGEGSAYITGYERSDMGRILQKNLEGTKFRFYPDPYPDQQLFYRSDNATLARQGVPAHTISTSKMDSEKFYHTQNDEIETLNLPNMAEIIRAIATSSTSIVAGKDTPSRVGRLER